MRDWAARSAGGVLSPFNAFLVARGLRTFPLRQRQQCLSAAILGQRLAGHPAVEAVHHPSLLSSPASSVAAKQMHAFGSILSFELRGGPGGSALERGKRLLGDLALITHAVSVGDLRTLAVHPASTTHASLPPQARAAAKIGDGLIRLSVGVEGVEDLWADLEAALAGAPGGAKGAGAGAGAAVAREGQAGEPRQAREESADSPGPTWPTLDP